MVRVSSPESLNNDVIAEILREYYNNANLKVISIDGNEDFLAKNDNFNSDIKKWTIQFQQVLILTITYQSWLFL